MTPLKFYAALEVVVFIALNSGAKPVSSKEVCAAQNVQARHLEPVMQVLVHNGILRGTKGPKGGYTLAKEKRKITVGQLLRIFTNKDEESFDTLLQKKVIIPLSALSEKAVLQIYDKITIEDLCKKATSVVDNVGQWENFNI
ncbi:MAG: Rrf2 family transcriptional regulator [Rickettsiaceae bacterium]|jgi:Rrf2 family protein|nr:Rrf2 family transcriptional regulator [Rickettsiaceae bacterium]